MKMTDASDSSSSPEAEAEVPPATSEPKSSSDKKKKSHKGKNKKSHKDATTTTTEVNVTEDMGDRLPNAPSLVEAPPLRFLVFDSPADELMPLYMKEFKKYGVTDVVCACELSYDTTPIIEAGIKHHVMSFADGAAPPPAVVKAWLHLVKERFGTTPIDSAFLKALPPPGSRGPAASSSDGNSSIDDKNKPVTIGVHCSAGLGRAPVLVTIALIERGMRPLIAVDFVRRKHPGAINSVQLQFFQRYKRQTSSGDCLLM